MAHAVFDIVRPARVADRQLARSSTARMSEWEFAVHDEAAYGWLADRLGFWPLFLAVGETEEDRRVTGYQMQW